MTEIFILFKKNFRQHQQKLVNFIAIVWVCIEMNRIFKVPKGDSSSGISRSPWTETLYVLPLLVRYTPVCEVHCSPVLKLNSRPLSPEENDLPGFSRAIRMAVVSTALCYSLLTAVLLGVSVKRWDTRSSSPATGSQLHPAHSPLPGFPLFLLSISPPNTGTCIAQQMTFTSVFTVVIPTV